MPPRADRRFRSALVAIAVALGAGLLAGCEFLGLTYPPSIAIDNPINFSTLTDSPAEIRGTQSGPVDEIAISIDGQPAGGPEPANAGEGWKLRLSSDLATGTHWIRAVGTGPEETVTADAVFAITTLPFAIAFAPDRLVVDRSRASIFPVQARLGLLGPLSAPADDLNLTLEDSGGLPIHTDPSNVLRRSGDGANPNVDSVRTGSWVMLDLTVTGRTPTGEHRIVIRADGPPGTEPQRATLRIRIIDGAVPATDANPPRNPGG